MIHTLGGALSGVTGIFATLCTHSCMASVMCGITRRQFLIINFGNLKITIDC